MIDLTLIILTFNEELHLKRCIESVKNLNLRVVVVDSYSTDETKNIARQCGADFYQNAFVNQAQQFQWAMDNCQIDSQWVLRLDADEYINDELSASIERFIVNDGYGNNAAIFNRKHIFLGKWVRFGGRYPLPMIRLFKNGTAHIEQRWMDEHIVLDSGTSIVLEGGFFDDNLNSVSWFIDKHNKYATREVVDITLKKISPELSSNISQATGFKIKFKRALKQNIYLKLPYFIRPLLYFLFRYFFQLGFLDGSRGFAYHFLQAFWYRALVDLKCLELEQKLQLCKNKGDKLRVLEEFSGYKLSRDKK